MCLLRSIWKDPVISIIIATGILSIISFLIGKSQDIIVNIEPWILAILFLSFILLVLIIYSIVKLLRRRFRPKTLVYLSVGGSCRDPIAKAITEQLLKTKGVKFRIKIKALAVSDHGGKEISYGAKYAIKSEYGSDLLANQKCGRISKRIYKEADLILVMSRDVLKELKMKFPEENDQVYLFKDFFGIEGDVYNPWPDGKDEETLKKYNACKDEIKEILDSGIDKLVDALSV